jgi:cupin superfamily acireductone dioxygenase involved in methionine salvage
MARVYKVEMYVIDYNDEIQDEQHLVEQIDHSNTLKWVSTKVSDVEKSKEFEWDDNLAINKMYPEVDELEKYFKN